MALVVEDEVLVNMDVAEALRDDGVETLQAYRSPRISLSILCYPSGTLRSTERNLRVDPAWAPARLAPLAT